MQIKDQVFFREILNRYQNYSSSHRFLIAVVGSPGSGKSYLAERLPSELNELLDRSVATSFAMDAYHLHNDILQAQGILPHKGCHFTFDVEAFSKILLDIKEKLLNINCPIYDRSLHNPTPNAKIISASHRIVVVEGNYLLLDIHPWQLLKHLFNYTIFIEVDDLIQYERLLARHTASGKSKKEAVAKISRTDLPNGKLIERSKHRADQILRPLANFNSVPS